MVYEYTFDKTSVGKLRFSRYDYELLHKGEKLLRDEIKAWNQKALDHGASRQPYEREMQDLDRMIKWEDGKLEHPMVGEITEEGVSVGSLRYMKAALILGIRRKEEEVSEKMAEGWPEGVIAALRENIDHMKNLEREIDFPPSEILWELIPTYRPLETESETMEWDVFISHATEDKEEFVRPLAEALRARRLRVYYDEFTLKIGDSLRRSIDRGLAHSRYGIVVISPSFLVKEWPQKELDGLVAREVEGRKVILPVWHKIDADGVRRYSPTLSDRVAALSIHGIDRVVTDLLDAMDFSTGQRRVVEKRPALVIVEPREEEVFAEYVEVSGTGARPGSAIILVTSLYDKYLATQKGSVVADGNGNWRHPKCHLLNVERDRVIYALAVSQKHEDRVRELLQQKGKSPVDMAMHKFRKVLKSERIPFQLSPGKRLLRRLRFSYGVAEDLGNLLQFEEQSKLVDLEWPEKSGQVTQAAQKGFEFRWSRSDKVESRRLEGWDIWYEVDKVRRVRNRFLLEDGSILIARRKSAK